MQAFPDAGGEDRELLEVATAAAGSAAAAHREASPSGAAWREKARADFVTDVDREAERRIVAAVRERFPDHRIVAEESADDAAEGGPAGDAAGGAPADPGGGAFAGGPGPAGGAGVRAPISWIVDPLDGTTNWLHGYPEHAVSIACCDGEGLRVAVVLNSATGELFQAVRGRGTRRDGEPVRVSGVGELRMALVGTGFPFKRPDLVEGYLPTLGRLIEVTSGVRRGGSAALDLCALACGRLDAFWELWLMPWDVAAGALMVREAGGVFGPLDLPGVPAGQPVDASVPDLRPGAFVAANAELTEAFRALVVDDG